MYYSIDIAKIEIKMETTLIYINSEEVSKKVVNEFKNLAHDK